MTDWFYAKAFHRALSIIPGTMHSARQVEDPDPVRTVCLNSSFTSKQSDVPLNVVWQPGDSPQKSLSVGKIGREPPQSNNFANVFEVEEYESTRLKSRIKHRVGESNRTVHWAKWIETGEKMGYHEPRWRVAPNVQFIQMFWFTTIRTEPNRSVQCSCSVRVQSV
jgi:hypothetical protein